MLLQCGIYQFRSFSNYCVIIEHTRTYSMISVAIASFNGEKFIAEQIKSILDQSQRVDEIIISDDCSSDRTVEIINEIIISNPDRKIKLLCNEKNNGYIVNFRKAISNTSGDYIFLADQDDVWVHDKVSKIITFMNKEKAEIVCTNFNIIDANGCDINDKYVLTNFVERCTEKSKLITLDDLKWGNISQGCTYCFTKRVKNIYTNINYDGVIHDYELLIIGASLYGAYYINDKLIKYRLHGNNALGFQKAKNLKNVNFVPHLRRPRMEVFYTKLAKEVKIKNLFGIKIFYYLKIPVIHAAVDTACSRIKNIFHY